MNIGTGLASLGLVQYQAVFRKHQIEADVLTELIDQHLRELRVPLGYRLRRARANQVQIHPGDKIYLSIAQPTQEDLRAGGNNICPCRRQAQI